MCAFAQNLTVPRAVCLLTPFTALQVLKLFVTKGLFIYFLLCIQLNADVKDDAGNRANLSAWRLCFAMALVLTANNAYSVVLDWVSVVYSVINKMGMAVMKIVMPAFAYYVKEDKWGWLHQQDRDFTCPSTVGSVAILIFGVNSLFLILVSFCCII